MKIRLPLFLILFKMGVIFLTSHIYSHTKVRVNTLYIFFCFFEMIHHHFSPANKMIEKDQSKQNN